MWFLYGIGFGIGPPIGNLLENFLFFSSVYPILQVVHWSLSPSVGFLLLSTFEVLSLELS